MRSRGWGLQEEISVLQEEKETAALSLSCEDTTKTHPCAHWEESLHQEPDQT